MLKPRQKTSFVDRLLGQHKPLGRPCPPRARGRNLGPYEWPRMDWAADSRQIPNKGRCVRRFRRRAIYWPIALLMLAVGMCGRAQNVPSPGAAATNSAATKQDPISPTPQKERRPQSLPTELGNAGGTHDGQRETAARHAAKKLHLRVVGVHDGDTITGLDESKTQFTLNQATLPAPRRDHHLARPELPARESPRRRLGARLGPSGRVKTGQRADRESTAQSGRHDR